MSGEGLSPRMAVAIGLAAIVPVAVYGMSHSLDAGVMAGINVVIVIAALFYAMSPVEIPGSAHT